MTTDEERPGHEPQRRPKRRRIGYACDLCRAKKSRCDGERPTCGSCSERRQVCVYPPQKSKPVYTEDYVESLKAQNRLLEDQLRRRDPERSHAILSSQSDFAMSFPSGLKSSTTTGTGPSSQSGFRGPVRHSLSYERGPTAAQTSNQMAFALNSSPSGSAGIQDPSLETTAARASTAPETGNPRTARAYFGESSTFNFLEKVISPQADDGPSGSATSPSGALAATATSSNPYDGLIFAAADDSFRLPPRPIADGLVQSYFDHRHPLNPYLHEGRFRRRYERTWIVRAIGGESATEDTLGWWGLVNMIFAFGYDHDSDGRNAASVERVRCFKRAQMLIFSGLLQCGTVELVQALLLLGQFYHSDLELNTCWTVVGLAIRVAQGLGMHMCPRSSTGDLVEQEVRRRTWWGCFIQDRLLSVKVGRRPSIDETQTKIKVLPLSVDDEYITDESIATDQAVQPAGAPSKLEFFRHAIFQARLLGQTVESLYGFTPCQAKEKEALNVSDLVARCIKLDGDLVSWQQALPAHLQFDSDAGGWLWERQRSVLLMRFLGARQLIHRQVLLAVIARRIEDPFQNELVHLCVGRCVAAAYDTICQMAILQQRSLMRSGWHNSHYVFAALCIFVAFRTLDLDSQAQARLPESIDVLAVFAKGMEILEKAGELHSLATKYLEYIREWQYRLQSLSAHKNSFITPQVDGASAPAANGQPLDSNGGTLADAMATRLSTNQFGVDVGTGFFDIENLFDPQTWFDMPCSWNEPQPVR